MDDDIPELTVSSVEQRAGNINEDHDGNSHLICIFQQCDETVTTKNSKLPEVVALIHTTKTNTVTVETPRLKRFLQAQAADLESQALTHTVRLTTSLVTYTATVPRYDRHQ